MFWGNVQLFFLPSGITLFHSCDNSMIRKLEKLTLMEFFFPKMFLSQENCIRDLEASRFGKKLNYSESQILILIGALLKVSSHKGVFILGMVMLAVCSLDNNNVHQFSQFS